MTYLQIVNKVLRRLREDQVTDFSAAYTLLIAEFVAEYHKEVLEAHDWSVFNQEVIVPLTLATGEYLLDSTTDGTIYTIAGTTNHITRDALLQYQNGAPVVSWYATAATSDQGIPIKTQASWQEFNRAQQLFPDQQMTMPTYFALAQSDNGWRLGIWPKPDSSNPAAELRMLWNVPEAQLDPTTDATSRTISAPWRPVYLGALYLALNERGEEIGEPGNIAEQRYYAALSGAKETDINNSGRTNRYEFSRD